MKIILWDRYHCFLLLIASLLFIFVNLLYFIIVPAFISFILLFLISTEELKKFHPYAGWANFVTALRFLSIIVIALIYKYLSNFQIALFCIIIIPLDALDGYLARKRQEHSSMGAYFDMETDVFFVCIVSCILFLRNLAGYEILFAGFMRFFYVPLVYLFGFHRFKERKTKLGPFIASYVFIALSISFIMNQPIRYFLINSSLLLLVISFSYSFWLLLRMNFQEKRSGK